MIAETEKKYIDKGKKRECTDRNSEERQIDRECMWRERE